MIVETLRELQEEPTIKVQCGREISLVPASVPELLKIPNAGDYRITSVRVETWGRLAVSVEFNAEGDTPIQLYISGSDAEVIKTHEKLRREVSQATLGYLPCFVHDFLGKGQLVLFCGGLGLIAWIVAAGSGLFNLQERMGLLRFVLYGFGFPIAGATAGGILSGLLLTKVYPKGVFLIGAGAQEYESVKFRKQQLSIWTLVAGLVAAVVFAILEHWLHL